MRHLQSFRKVFVIVSALCSAVPYAQAQQSLGSESFWYAGGDIGYARDRFSTARPGWPGVSSNNVAVGLRGGYQFSRYVSVENTLSSLGSVEARSGTQKDKFTIGTWSTNVVGYLPITERLSLLGIVGVGWEFGRRRGDLESSSRSAGILNLGLGAAYAVTPNWRVRAQYLNYQKLNWKGSNDASVKNQAFLLGLDYMFR
jgi:OOP family OmpA-OmpF porin